MRARAHRPVCVSGATLAETLPNSSYYRGENRGWGAGQSSGLKGPLFQHDSTGKRPFQPSVPCPSPAPVWRF